MKLRTALIFLGLLTLSAGLLVTGYAEGVPRNFCFDWCSAQDRYSISAFNSFYDNLALYGFFVAFAGMALLMLQSLRLRLLSVVPPILGGIAAFVSGLFVVSEKVFGLQNTVIAVNEKFGFPFAYRTISCAWGLPSYCVGGAYTSFSLFLLLADLFIYTAASWLVILGGSLLRSSDLLRSKSGDRPLSPNRRLGQVGA